MSEDERKLLDTSGDYRYVVRKGEPVEDPVWQSCRVILTDERLVLATSDGKQAVPHPKIRVADPESVAGDGVAQGTATPLRIGKTVIVVDAGEDFEREYCRAALEGAVILVRHRAVEGGVVQDARWRKAKVRLDDDSITLAFPDRDPVSVALDDVGTVETGESEVRGETRPVVQVEHTDADDTSVETHFSGTEHHADALASLLEAVVEDREGDHELSETESQVLMALYSGVSPFEMADFVGLDVDEVEEIYQRLLEMGAVDKVRERTEVSLNAYGRNLASEAMSEQ